MLTTDPIYYKALLPTITINNTANNSTLYTYSSFTGAATGSGLTNVFPIYCSVSLSQNTFGEFTIQFEDQNKVMENVVTVGSRIIISCGKQSSALTRLISGLVRKKGYARGSDERVLYTVSGTSTGIRLNELIIYIVSEAAQLSNGQIDFNDASRKANTLLAAGLNVLTGDGVLSIANLAANSSVETFIANTNIQYGELQDLVNYYEDQSGGEVIVDTNDLVNFRYEIRNNLFGKGFTIKNSAANKANDDADDTMYLVNKNWSYEDNFYKSSNYANGIYALLPGESPPTTPGEIASSTYDPSSASYFTTGSNSVAKRFRPTHSHFYPADFYLGLSEIFGPTSGGKKPFTALFLIVDDAGSGTPANKTPILGLAYQAESFSSSFTPLDGATIVNRAQSFNPATGDLLYPQDFILDIQRDYWFIMTSGNTQSSAGATDEKNVAWWYDSSKLVPGTVATAAKAVMNPGGPFSNTGGPWTVASSARPPLLAMPRIRSHSFVMYDPKARQAVSSGLTKGLGTDALLTDAPSQITSFDSMYRYMQQQIYNLVKPRTVYNFPTVLAPNIPPFPGDPLIVSDDVLGFSTAGNQIALTTCGDMTYQWGNMESGSYDAPTKLSIQAIGIHPRYR